MEPTVTSRMTGLRRTALTLLGTSSVAILGVLLGTASPAAAADQTIELYAVTGSTSLPGAASVAVLGYNDTNTPVTKPGGPVIVVNQGDSVTINLHNELGAGVQTALVLEGQSIQPDTTGVGNGGTATYTFTADKPGTFLYEAGLVPNTQYQTAMGLHGALVVLPTSSPDTVIPGQAYADASSAFDSASVLVLSELDPALNNAANPAAFDMRTFKPRYFLVDGQVHPNIAPIAADGDSDVLLRYVNAGITYHSMGVLGATDQRVIALDGFPLTDARHYVADTIGPGQTLDAIVHTPASASVVQRLSVYDAAMRLRNANTAGLGGMLATVEVGDTPPSSDTLGPVSSAALFDSGTTTLTAGADDTARGGSTVAAARAYVDDLSTAPVDLAAADSAFDEVQEDLTGSISGVASGEHTIYVQAQDSAGNWGPVTSVLVTGGDVGGPTVVQPVLTPQVTRHPAPAAIAISASGDDSATGNSNVVAAEYSIGDTAADAGTGTAMTVTAPAPVAELTGSIGQAALDALAEGNHAVWVRAQDSQGNWGEAVTVNLAVDLSSPEIQGSVDVAKTPNNGTTPLTPSQQVVRVSVLQVVDPTVASVSGTIDKVEMFLDNQGANGSGIPMTASDGLFNDQAEGAYGDIPLTTVAQMTSGSHTIWVHARDNAGNWSPFSSGTLVVDRVAPAIGAFSITPSPAVGAPTLTVDATVTEALTGVTAGEWFIGTAPTPGSGTPLGALNAAGASPYAVTGTISAADLGEGTWTIRVRFKDGAGNWSTTSSATVTVTPGIYFSTRGNTNPTGVTGTADDADIYYWNGAGYSRSIDMTTTPATYGVPASANVDGFDRVDATHFYVSFEGATTTITGLGTVQDEDVLYYNAGTWSVFFDGTAHGLTTAGEDIDALSVAGTMLSFSTVGNVNPPGVGGAADDADVYRVDTTTFAYTRAFDATANGLAAGANVDGLVWVSGSQLYLSFEPTTTAVPGLGNVPDENVVFLRGGVWKTYFNGAGHGLNTSGNLDIDAFDLP